jgi:hypothetical protein
MGGGDKETTLDVELSATRTRERGSVWRGRGRGGGMSAEGGEVRERRSILAFGRMVEV